MKKKLIVLTLFTLLGIFASPAYIDAGCGSCTTSSTSSENAGRCRQCIGSEGDACVNTSGQRRTACTGQVNNSNEL